MRALIMRSTRANDCLVQAHACDDSAHVSKALGDAGHRIVFVDLVFEVDIAFVADIYKGAEDCRNRHDAVSNRNLTLFYLAVGEVFHVEIEKPWSDLFD